MAPGAGVHPVREIPLQLIDDPELPSRIEMHPEKMQELVASIRAEGILQNLVLVERGDRFEVVAGHRRTIAARLAGLAFVPAKVYPPDHPSLRVIQAHENGRREDVNPVDEAFWFAELLEKDCGNDVTRLAGLVGEGQNYVLGRLELLELDDETRDALRAGQIKIGVAKALRLCSAPQYRHYFVVNAIRDGATEATVRGWIENWRRNILEPSQLGSPAPAPSPAAIAVTPHDPFRCFVCRKSDHRIPEMLPVHGACREAILEPLLQDSANGRT